MDKKDKAKKPLFKPEEKLRIKDPEARERVKQITFQFMMSMVAKGELNPGDEEAMKKATKSCARDAWEAYKAAEEYLCG